MKHFLTLLFLTMPLPAMAATDLHPFTRGSWQELRQGHAGKPLVVQFWGVTCGPCLAELPHWGELMRARSDMNLVLVEADLVSEPAAKVAQILGKAGLSKAESWAFADYFEDKLRFEIDPAWQGELPRTVLIAADGTVKTIAGGGDIPTVRAWLDAQNKRQ